MPSPRWSKPATVSIGAAIAAAQHAAWVVAAELRVNVFTQRLRQQLGADVADRMLDYALALFKLQPTPPDGWVDPPSNMHFDCCPRCMQVNAKRYSQAPNGRVKLNALRDREWLAQQLQFGRTPAQIAEMLGCIPASVKIWIDKHSLERTRHKINDEDVAHLHDAGLAPGEISECLDLRVKQVRRILKRTRNVTMKDGHHYFKKEWWVERIITRQMTTNECAAAAGIYPHACSYWLKQFGLSEITKARGVRTLRRRWKLKYPVLADPEALKALMEKHGTWMGIAREVAGSDNSASLVKSWWLQHFGKPPACIANGRRSKSATLAARGELAHSRREWWIERLDRGLTTMQLAEDAGLEEKAACEKLRVFGGDLLARGYQNNTRAERLKRPPQWARKTS